MQAGKLEKRHADRSWNQVAAPGKEEPEGLLSHVDEVLGRQGACFRRPVVLPVHADPILPKHRDTPVPCSTM